MPGIMKVRCPDCRERFELDQHEYEEGDFLSCPECAIDLVIMVKKGKLKVVSDKEKFMEEESDEFVDLEEEEP